MNKKRPCIVRKPYPSILPTVEHTIIYKDTEGMWDGYIFSHGSFFPLREAHWLKAAIKYVNNYVK